MPNKYGNRIKVNTSTTGTGTITLGSAVDGFQTFSSGGITDGSTVAYVIEDGANFEIGTGTYTASGTTLSRSVSESNNSNNAINLSGSAVVFVSPSASDLPFTDGASFTGAVSFAEDVTFTGANYNVVWDKSDNSFEFGDNAKAVFGAGSDLQIYHDGNHSYIVDQGTGHLKVFAEHFFVNNSDDTEQMIGATVNGAVDLFFNGSNKLATTSSGINVTGTVTDDGAVHDGDVTFTGASYSAVWDKSDNALEFADNAKAIFGAGSDLQIYHDGSHSYIEDAGTGELRLRGNASVKINQFNNNEAMAIFNVNGSVDLRYDNLTKLETTSSGIDVTGNISVSGTVDGRDVATDGSKLDGIEASADVTDATNVTAAGAAMLSGAAFTGDVGIGMSPDSAVKLSVNGAVGPTNGSASAPTHTFYSDPDTGMFRTAANTLGFSAGGTEYVQIGSFGVASDTLTNKTASADVVIDAAGGVILDADDLGTISLKDGGTRYGVFRSSSGTFTIQAMHSSNNNLTYQANTHTFDNAAGSTEYMRLNTTGLGIGVSPSDKLHIKNESGTTVFRADVNANSTVGLEINKTGSTTQSWKIADGVTVNGALEIYDATDSRSVMMFDGSGNVGIGCNPVSHLDVMGAGLQYIKVGSTNANGAGLILDGDSNGDGSGSDYSYILHNTSGNLEFNVGNPSNTVGTRMTILAGGNVGIASTNPSAKLEIKQSAASVFNDNDGNSLRLEYAGSPNANDIGPMMTFAQHWYASSSDVIRTGGIAGIKTVGSGAYGGGLAFYAQPNSGSDMNQAMVINHLGNVRFGNGNSYSPTIQGITNNGRTEASPAYTFTDDLDTGMFNPATADTIAFATNGSERVRIKSNGNVGIGTTNPSSLLDLTKTTAGSITGGTGNKGAVLTLHHEAQWENGYTGGDWLGALDFSTGDASTGEGVRASIRTRVDTYYNTNSLAFYTCDQGDTTLDERMTILSGGNVGIGEPSPSYKLDVGHVSSGAIQARFKSSGDTGYTQGAIVLESSDSSNTPSTRGQGVFMFNHGNDRTWYSGTTYAGSGNFAIGTGTGASLNTAAADNGAYAMLLDTSKNALFAANLTASGSANAAVLRVMSGATEGPSFTYGNTGANMYFNAGGSGADTGISFFNSAGNWTMQLYGYNAGSTQQYGFLDANWSSWDIQKTPSGPFLVDEGGGLKRILNEGNYASQISSLNDVQFTGLYVGATNTSYDFYNNGTSYFNGTTTIDDLLAISSTAEEKIRLTGATSPYIMFQEGTTNRAYIQWEATANALRFKNQENDNFEFITHAATGALQIRLLGSDGDTWGSIYATDSQEIGFLDEGGNWAYRIENDSKHEWRINNAIEMDLINSQLDVKTNHIITTGNITGGEIYANGFFRNNDAGEGLYNETTARHFFSASATYWHIVSSQGLVFYTSYNSTAGGSTGRVGYVYHDSSGFGLLNSAGNWTVQCTAGNNGVVLKHSGTTRLSTTTTGVVTAGIHEATSFTATSDLAKKEDLSPVTDALNKVKTLTGYTYTMKDTGLRNAGLIAQEVEAVLPEAVDGPEGEKTLDYAATISLLVNAIKEQAEQIEVLKARLEILEN